MTTTQTTDTTEDTMIQSQATFGDDKGRQWWITVDPDTGKAKLVIGRAGCASERFDIDNATRLALVRALAGVGD